eukprot:TRINITY_DN11160_c0_g1_i2.p1 TRINITY_DN11160_c0_g1~~TRINITY_DN11160_c0_g1_i2.p1  ORF type:complete len:120 (-),score=0.76 TRINITY_DN11160_c0_g1_i2:307-666(-)
MRISKPTHRRRLVWILLLFALAFSIAVISIQYFLFSGIHRYDLKKKQIKTLYAFQNRIQKCVKRNGLGLEAHIVDHCKIIFAYPAGTNSTWYNEQFKIYEPLEYTFDVCDAIVLWKQGS